MLTRLTHISLGVSGTWMESAFCVACIDEGGITLLLHAGYRWQLVRSSDKTSSPPHASSALSEASAASDRGSDAPTPHETGSTHHLRSHTGTAGELDRLRTALRQKEDQMASLQSQLTNLEATRDRSAPAHEHCSDRNQ